MNVVGSCSLGHGNVPGAMFCATCGQALLANTGAANANASALAVPSEELSPVRRRSFNPIVLMGVAVLVAVLVGVSFPVRSALNSTTVPNVSGMTRTAAQASAMAASLGALSATEEFSDTVPVGFIIRQSPSAGGTAAKDSALAIVLSQGPRLVTLSVTNDLSDGVMDFDLDLSCSTYVRLFSGIYSDSTLIDDNDVKLGSMTAAGWVPDPSNGTYFPCLATATFEEVPENRDRYRVNLSTDDPENNNLGWFTGEDARAQNWRIEE